MSAVIKASGPSRDGAPFNLGDMADQAHQYLDQVRQEAARIVQQAHEEAAELRASAQRHLDEQVEKQTQTLLSAIRQAAVEIGASRQAWLANWEKAALKVAATIGGRLARRAALATPEITLDLVREALELAAGSAEVEVHLHPDDFAALSQHTERIASELMQLGASKVVADVQISRGGCRVQTHFGLIDQQFEAQVARIEQELT